MSAAEVGYFLFAIFYVPYQSTQYDALRQWRIDSFLKQGPVKLVRCCFYHAVASTVYSLGRI